MSTKNPTELLDRYLQAIRFWMPKTKRQEELVAELGEDLRSQIEDKETELGRRLDEGEVAAILKRCGSPMVVAGSLGPTRQLIGPALYPIYIFVLKMVLLWILVPVFLFIIGPVNVASGDWGPAIAATIGQMWSGMFIAAGIITLVFAFVERTARSISACAGVDAKWDPLKLPPVRKEEQKFSPFKLFCETMFASIGLCWVLLVPHYPALILGPAAGALKAGPIWQVFYLPLVFLSVLAVLRPAITMSKPAWRAFPLWFQLLQTVLTLVFVHALVNAAHLQNGGWAPFVVPANGASANYVVAAAWVNLSILVCAACAWLGLCIAGIVQVWQLVRFYRKRTTLTMQSASLLT